jgi:hypothetical protein
VLLDRRFKPEVAVSKDPKRPTLQHPRLSGKGFIEATDSFIAVRVPCELEADADGMIPVEAIKLARTIGDKKQAIRLDCNGGVDVPDVASFERHTQEALPDIASAFDGLPKLTPTVFGINAAMLARAAKALGCNEVQLEVFTRETAIRVTPLHGLGGEAIVMPVRIRDGASG